MDKAKRTVNDVVRYVQEVAQDERLRADVSSALAHGSKASQRLQKNIDAGGISDRLASDRKLRRNLRAMLDDLDHASDRMRRKPRHRLRNFLLAAAGVVGVALALPKIRALLTKRTDVFGTTDTEPEPVA
jgi:hypothetical protein